MRLSHSHSRNRPHSHSRADRRPTPALSTARKTLDSILTSRAATNTGPVITVCIEFGLRLRLFLDANYFVTIDNFRHWNAKDLRQWISVRRFGLQTRELCLSFLSGLRRQIGLRYAFADGHRRPRMADMSRISIAFVCLLFRNRQLLWSHRAMQFLIAWALLITSEA